jgi:lactoylglutathione lyase
MRFGYTIIYVPDVEATMQFYKKAFNLNEAFLHESKQYGELSTGDTKLAFVSEALSEMNGVSFVKNSRKNTAPGFEIALVADDVSKAYAHAVDAGAMIVTEPASKPWGQWVAYVRDNNGVLVEICSPIG